MSRRGEPITRRQRELLGYVAEGYTVREASDRLGISYRTGEKHIDNLHQRLGTWTLAHAVAFCIYNRLLTTMGESNA